MKYAQCAAICTAGLATDSTMTRQLALHHGKPKGSEAPRRSDGVTIMMTGHWFAILPTSMYVPLPHLALRAPQAAPSPVAGSPLVAEGGWGGGETHRGGRSGRGSGDAHRSSGDVGDGDGGGTS